VIRGPFPSRSDRQRSRRYASEAPRRLDRAHRCRSRIIDATAPSHASHSCARISEASRQGMGTVVSSTIDGSILRPAQRQRRETAAHRAAPGVASARLMRERRHPARRFDEFARESWPNGARGCAVHASGAADGTAPELPIAAVSLAAAAPVAISSRSSVELYDRCHAACAAASECARNAVGRRTGALHQFSTRGWIGCARSRRSALRWHIDVDRWRSDGRRGTVLISKPGLRDSPGVGRLRDTHGHRLRPSPCGDRTGSRV